MSHYKHMKRPDRRKAVRRTALLLAALVLCLGLPVWSLGARAASTPTSLGLAQHGINAYNEGWQYSYGGKGETIDGVRVSDCAGLIYAYFSDLGVGGCMGGATSQATKNCIFAGTISEGVPRIHGLALTIFDTDDPADGYSHIGIYIGNNQSCDNSTYGTNMLRDTLENRHWDSWHLFDNGVMYPRNGWYELEGKMVHYTDYEYDVDTTIDGYYIGTDGYAALEDGSPAPVDESLLSSEYVPASEVRDWLSTNGWSGTDNPSTPDVPDFQYNATVNGSSVNLRAEPNTTSTVMAVLSDGTKLQLGSAVEGEDVIYTGAWLGDPDHVGDPNYGGWCGVVSNLWYPATTATGKTGYISEHYINLHMEAPTITSDGESVTMTAGGSSSDIYYTTDGTEPTEDSTPYVSPVYQLGCTYSAVSIKGGVSGPVTTATVLKNGALFTDFTYKDWFAPMVDKAVTLKLFNGAGKNTFLPRNEIKRAEFVKVLAQLSGEDLSAYELDTSKNFTDVPSNAYYRRHLAWAVSNGIVSPAKKFSPNDTLPREQMCTMLDRYMTKVLGVTDVDTSKIAKFADDSSISSWAKTAVYRMRALGIVNGEGQNRFNPKGTTQRCAASKVAVLFYEKLIEPYLPDEPATPDEPTVEPDPTTAPDNDLPEEGNGSGEISK